MFRSGQVGDNRLEAEPVTEEEKKDGEEKDATAETPPAEDKPSEEKPTEEKPLDEKPVEPEAPELAAEAPAIAPGVPRLEPPTGAASTSPDLSPGYGFLTVVSILSLVADLATKVWAKERLETFPGYVQVFEKHWNASVAGMSFILAHNKGGAWGLLQGTNENVRKPFFLLVSAAAIAFIVTLFRRLQPNQRALKWGLPLVLGGALGNVFDRIRYGSVIDFIDVHIERGGIDHHWPTFNVADIAICVGVGLMAVDMFTAKRQPIPRKKRSLAAKGITEPAMATEVPEEKEIEPPPPEPQPQSQPQGGAQPSTEPSAETEEKN
jgi:signal peptidase II